MKILIALLVAALVAACAAAPQPLPGPNPSDAAAVVPRQTYRSAFSDYVARRPVEPKPWLEQNEGVAPRR